MKSAIYTLAALIALAAAYAVYIYNTLVRKKAYADNGWSQIDVQLKRRFDLIPNLVETVKAYAAHEREIFEQVAALRSASLLAKTVEEAAPLQNRLTGALKSLLAVSENYPELKANQNFLALQEALTSTENKIAFARQSYNDQVLFYNNQLQMFPSNIIAGMFNFTKRDYFEIENEAERSVPQVKF